MPYYRDLQESLDYWDEQAQEGATHYGIRSHIWCKKEGRQWFSWNGGKWVSCGRSWPALTVCKPKA